jgi:hypothetical protein
MQKSLEVEFHLFEQLERDCEHAEIVLDGGEDTSVEIQSIVVEPPETTAVPALVIEEAEETGFPQPEDEPIASGLDNPFE